MIPGPPVDISHPQSSFRLPDHPMPNLVVQPADVISSETQEEWRPILKPLEPPLESFRLLVAASGRSSVHPSKPILASPRGPNVQFWDMRNGSLIETYRIDPSAKDTLFTSAKYSPDGQTIAFGSPYGPMKLMRLSDKSLVSIPTDRSFSADRIAFHPNGQRFVAVGERTPKGRTIPNAYWVDLQSGQSHLFVPDEAKVVDVAVDDAGQFIGIAETNAIAIYNTATQEQQIRFPLAVEPTCLVASPDGNWIVGLADGTVRTWSAQTGEFVEEEIFDTGPGRVIDIDRFDKTNRFCILTGEETVILWDRETSTTRFVGYHPTAHCAIAIPGEEGVVTVGVRNGSRIWPMPDPNATSEPNVEAQLTWSLVTISANGSKIAAVGKYVHVWNVSDGKCLTAFKPKTRWVKDVHLSPDGSLIALVGHGLKAEVWSVTEHRLLDDYFDPNGESRWPSNIQRRSRCVRFSEDGQQLMVAEQDALRIYDVQSRQRVVELATVAPKFGTVRISMLQAMDTDRHTGRIALAHTGRVVIWDPEDDRVLKTVNSRGAIDTEHPGVFFSEDGSRIAICHLYRVAVYNIDSGKLLDELSSHWVHGRLGDGWLVSNRGGEVSQWSAATDYVPRYERKRRRPTLTPVMNVQGQLRDVAFGGEGNIVLIDQRDRPLVYSK